jgi:hypothetical protein
MQKNLINSKKCSTFASEFGTNYMRIFKNSYNLYHKKRQDGRN